MLEPERERLGLHLRELVGVVVTLEREGAERRPEVLTDGQDVDVDRAERLERLVELISRLAETDHQRALVSTG